MRDAQLFCAKSCMMHETAMDMELRERSCAREGERNGSVLYR